MSTQTKMMKNGLTESQDLEVARIALMVFSEREGAGRIQIGYLELRTALEMAMIKGISEGIKECTEILNGKRS
jgi:hypothetical protein